MIKLAQRHVAQDQSRCLGIKDEFIEHDNINIIYKSTIRYAVGYKYDMTVLC